MQDAQPSRFATTANRSGGKTLAKWHAAHYNALAKEIRLLYPVDDNRVAANIKRRTLEDLALNLAVRFEKDNELFKPVKFLDACSPDDELYPLGVLWEDHVADR
jgi:hypothetical protein